MLREEENRVRRTQQAALEEAELALARAQARAEAAAEQRARLALEAELRALRSKLREN